MAKKFTFTEKDIQELPLIENSFFMYAADGNLEFARYLIEPVMDYLKIKDYTIESAKAEVTESHFTSHDVRLDLEVRTAAGDHFIIEVQNLHPERMNLKRLRYIHSSHDVKVLKKGEGYESLPKVIVLCYTREPLEGLDDGNPVAVIAPYNLVTGEPVDDGTMTFIVNGKYEDEAFDKFSRVIKELEKTDIDEIEESIIKNIHKEIKENKERRQKLSSLIEQYMGDYVEEIANLQAAMRKQKQDSDRELEKQKLNLREAEEEIERLKKELKEFKENGSDSTSD